MATKDNKHITAKNRSKIYKATKIKSSVSAFSIPKGKNMIQEREKIIENYIRKIKGSIYCPALNADVAITRTGRNETIFRASGKYKSTIAALTLEDALTNADWIKSIPKKRNVKAQKIYKKLHLLAVIIRGVGIAKILVGEVDLEKYNSEKDRFKHYCITQVSIRDIK